jgi:hypothetical protein
LPILRCELRIELRRAARIFLILLSRVCVALLTGLHLFFLVTPANARPLKRAALLLDWRVTLWLRPSGLCRRIGLVLLSHVYFLEHGRFKSSSDLAVISAEA